MIKILFLDMDGVIAPGKTGCEIDDYCEKLLDKILRETGCYLVISSSWRKHELDLTKEYFNRRGFKFTNKIIGMTIRGYHYIDKKDKIHLSIPRGVEIKQWIDTHIHSDNGKNFNRKKLNQEYTYCIVDDDSDMLLEHKNNFVQVEDGHIGLQWHQTEKIIEILNNKVPDENMKQFNYKPISEKQFQYNYHYFMYTFILLFMVPFMYCYMIINPLKLEPFFSKPLFWFFNWAIITGLVNGAIAVIYRNYQLKKLMKNYE